jgi:hypothetical protein
LCKFALLLYWNSLPFGYRYDCDGFTRNYLAEHFGVTDFTPIELEEERNSLVLPKINGADSDPSLRSLIPKPPKKNFQKMLDNERKVLRFSATLRSDKAADAERVFVVSFYLADDTVGVYEPPQR